MLVGIAFELLSICWSFVLLFLVGQLYYALVSHGKYLSVEFFFTLPAYALSLVSCVKKVSVLLLSTQTGHDYLDLSYIDVLFSYGNMYIMFYMCVIWAPVYLARRQHAIRRLRLQSLSREE